MRKSDGRSRGHTALYSTVPPPTPLKFPSTMSESAKVDRVVGREATHVRRGRPGLPREELPVRPRTGVHGGVLPSTLFEAHDP